MAATGALKRSIVAIILVFTVLSINCVGGNQQPINNPPNETINIIADEEMILTGGQSVWITAQLYYKGEPLREKDVNITFLSDDSSIATLPVHNYNVTDDNGSTRIILYSGDMPGRVKVTAFYNSGNGTVLNVSYVNVSRWGSIGGIVFDESYANIPNANVSLWSCHFNDSTHKWEKDSLLAIPENPQLSNDGRTGYAGQFAFYRVPVGTYILMAEKEGHNNTLVVVLEQGTATCIINLPGYVFLMFNSSTMGIPSPTPNGNNIWGIVCDQNKVSIPNANVSLWHCNYNRPIGQWEKTTVVDIAGNPVKAGNGKVRPGEYRFENLPRGTYYVMADDEGHEYYAIVHLNSNQSVAYIVLPEWEKPPPFVSSPTPSPP